MGQSSVWPCDFLKEPHEIERRDASHLIVFLMSPYSPVDHSNELFELCREICDALGKLIGANVQCVRADSFATPKIIHEDIWAHIQRADALITDVSGANGNVMLELGVAAAIRDKNQVIVIHEQESEYKFLFDISPARHLSYRRSVRGDSRFRDQLARALLFALAPAPYVPASFREPQYPIDVELTIPDAAPFLLSPANAYRKYLGDGLEFGSFFIPAYSWVSLGMNPIGDIHIRAEMRVSELRPGDTPGSGWIGIMLRGQHFLANYGHLVYLLTDGNVRFTKPLSEFHKEEPDPHLGLISNFTSAAWVDFYLLFRQSSITGKVGGVNITIDADGRSFIHNAGALRLQTFRCRAVLRRLYVERLD